MLILYMFNIVYIIIILYNCLCFIIQSNKCGLRWLTYYNDLSNLNLKLKKIMDNNLRKYYFTDFYSNTSETLWSVFSPPSTIPASKHFVNRQAWHSLDLTLFFTSQFPSPLQTYLETKFFCTVLLKKLLQPSHV